MDGVLNEILKLPVFVLTGNMMDNDSSNRNDFDKEGQYFEFHLTQCHRFLFSFSST